MTKTTTKSDATRFRRDLLNSYELFSETRDTYRASAMETGADSAPAAAWRASIAASTYAYVLAAVIAEIGRDFGQERADEYARLIEDQVTNGDFDNLNGDLPPSGGDDA